MTVRRDTFDYLSNYDGQLVRLGLLAEECFSEDPSTCTEREAEGATMRRRKRA